MMRSAGSVYGLLVLASAAYCLCLFGGMDCWGRGDWDQFSFRFETPRTAMLRDGQLPLWNPYVNGGNVLLAHPHCPAFSPWYLTTLIFGAPLALRVSVVLFMALGAVGMAALLRRWEVSWAGCLAGGVLLMMSAHFAMHVAEGHLEWCVLGLMPWVLLCLLEAERDWRFVILGALVLASAWLYGSIYIVAVFAPLLGIWAVLESVRTRSWLAALNYVAVMGLTLLLCAVALFPRMEFLRANPRKTERHERVAPAALGRMLLDPGQAELYREIRDVRNPRVDELIRFLPLRPASPYETLKWHRLEITLSTTSDWSDLSLRGFPHLWFFDGPDSPDKTPARLNSLPLSEEGLRLKSPDPGKELATRQATLYVQLPEQGNLEFTVNRGSVGATRLIVRRKQEVLLDVVHASLVPGNLANARTFAIRRRVILGGGHGDDEGPAAPWYQLEATVKTTADWCRVEVVNCPYLFGVEPPRVEARHPVRLATTSLDVESRPPGKEESARRAIVYLQPPEGEDVRMAITQGPGGTTTLTLKTPQGEPLETDFRESTQPGGDKTRDYVLARRLVREKLPPVSTPTRWRLDELGMTHDWQEYGCYVTWLGLAMAVLGLIVSFRRQWPLAAIGMLAGLIALGAALPVNLWALWKLLPMYGSLQVPSRFLAAVVFVMAACAGHGVDRLGRWAERAGGAWLGRLLQYGIVLAIYAELAVFGWSLFSDVFVCPRRPVPAHAEEGFVQRYAADDVRYAAMYSAHYPYLLDNSGVLRQYENVAVPRGKIHIAGDPNYRGEAYLESSHGTARIERWSMSRVKVSLEVGSADRLLLNQNYFPGWKAMRRDRDGSAERLAAERSPDGLVSIAVSPGDREVEFYYRPDSFVWGAVVSGLTLLGCLGFLMVGSRRSWRSWQPVQRAVDLARRARPALRSKALGYVASAVVLNVPFLLCHADWTWIDAPLVRSLAVNAVLFLAPGLPLVGAMVGRGWLPRFGLLWAMALSLAVFVTLLAGTVLAGLPVEGGIVWSVLNGTWIVTNLGLLLNVLAGGPPGFGARLDGKSAWIGLLMFAVAYLAFFHAATRVVPVMDDHDYETQGTAYGLLTRLKMTLLTDRGTDFCYAHPPLSHLCVAASFLYYGQKDELAYYDEAWDRVQTAEPGDRAAVRDREVQLLYDQFRRNAHHRLATRTPNVFLAALTVGLLAWWIGQMTGHAWLGLLVPLAYATNPEVFVRSGYGGYFAISNFALVQILLAVEQRTKDRSLFTWMTCLLAGGFAGLANHKLLLLPVALVVWQVGRIVIRRHGLGGGRPPKTPARVPAYGLRGGWTRNPAAEALLHPVVLGFAAGWAMFWVYGLAVSPGVFVLEHFRHHLVDRMAHYNPLGYGLYPTVAGLWLEFWQHTGYVLLPLAAAALGMLCWAKNAQAGGNKREEETPGWRGTPGLWAVWVLLTALAFSVIDWRQTKHLMPLLLPLHLAPARWAATSRAALVLVGVLFAGLLLWNLDALRTLAADFDAFSITPAW